MSGVIRFSDVYSKVAGGGYVNEATFRQEFLEALRNELTRNCPDRARLLNPVLEYKVGLRKRADTRVFNVFFEFEIPTQTSSNVSPEKVTQLFEYLQKITDGTRIRGTDLFGFVTNGWFAQILKFPSKRPNQSGDFIRVTGGLLSLLCNFQSLGVTEPDDFIALFGAW